MSGRNRQISRIYSLVNLLDGARSGLTVAELTRRLAEQGHSATRRTVYRDLQALEAAGFPLRTSGEGGENNSARWTLEKVTRVGDHFLLSARELLALFFARGVLAPLRDTPFFRDLETLFLKIEARLGPLAKDYFQELGSEIHFDPGPRWGLGIDPHTLETVRACCAERQVLSVTYASASTQQKRHRELGPHYLYYAKGSLYLVAEDLESGAVKIFSVPRMSNASMKDAPYTGTLTDPADFFQGTFGVYRGQETLSVKIAVAPALASFVRERQWHESQRVVSKEDGSILVSLDVANTPELVQWILGLGPSARVVQPTELRRDVSKAARQIMANYRRKKAA